MAKKKEACDFKTWVEVDEALRRIAEIDAETDLIDGDLTVAVNELKSKAELQKSPLSAERRRLTEHITMFAESHKNEFVSPRSKELTFGKISYRIVESVVIRAKAATVAAIKALGLQGLLIVKEEPDKEALSRLEPSDLAKVGASIKTEDKIRIEAFRERTASEPK